MKRSTIVQIANSAVWLALVVAALYVLNSTDYISNPTPIVVLGSLVILQVLVSALLCCVYNYRKANRRHTHSLLANEHVHEFRMEGTAKEAQEGFNQCHFCGFENFKRTRFCSLCGDRIVVNPEPEPQDGETQQSKPIARPSPIRPANQPTNRVLTTRQKRALKRREWTRKVDVDGRAYWYRAPIEGDSKPRSWSMPAWTVVLQSDLTEDSVADLENVISVDVDQQESTTEESSAIRNGSDNDNSSNTNDVLPGTEDSNEGSAARSQAEVDDRTTTKRKKFRHEDPQWLNKLIASNIAQGLTEASNADASQFPNGQVIDPTSFQQTLELAAMDFPSRYSYFVAHTSSSVTPAQIAHMRFKVHRDFVFEESMDCLSCIGLKHIRSVMRIQFMGESGVDAGGVYREWFMLLNERLVDERFGLFRCTNVRDQSYYLNPNSVLENGEDHLVYYYGVGRLVGRALLEGLVLNFHFAVPLLKIMLGTPVSLEDLEYLDEDGYRGLVWLLENDQVDDLGLTFSVCESVIDEEGQRRMQVVDLLPNGREVDVTDANKHEFVRLKYEYLVFGSVSRQLHMFLRGVYEVIPLELLMLFDHEELDYILCGEQEINVDEWRKHTDVSTNLSGTATLHWFWEIVEEMPMEYRSRLLQFATGSSRLPASGFEGLVSYDGRLCRFTIKGVRPQVWKDRFIQGHACFNRIDLPYFWRREDLSKMLYAILDSDMYGFTES